jgi:hypothetical protein
VREYWNFGRMGGWKDGIVEEWIRGIREILEGWNFGKMKWWKMEFWKNVILEE